MYHQALAAHRGGGPHDGLYVAIPGPDLDRVVEALETIVTANETLAVYHRGRRQTLSTA